MHKLAYLNPFEGRAEDQAFHSLKAAADELGVSITKLLPSDLKETDDFDFVISTSAAVRKTTSHPHFLSAHLPRLAYVDDEAILRNLASYDGYLCIADGLIRFFSNLADTFGKLLVAPGFYYNAPQALPLKADVEALAADGELGLCYFGTNWDARAGRLLARLSELPYFRIYGPERDWAGVQSPAYKGQTPFDGISVQQEYARFGAGLVCPGPDHLLDDVASNRILEIASAGACAIVPDTPWTRRNFNDSVYYYNAFLPPAAAADEIRRRFQDIQADPVQAARRAAEAKRRFEERFSAQCMLRNAVAYYERWKAANDESAAPIKDCPVDVIMRAGGRPVSFIDRAIRSLEQQSAGRFRVLLVLHRPLDVSAVVQHRYERVEVEVIEAFGGNRSATLKRGLSALRAPYFAILDDDDYFLRDHFANLLRATKAAGDRKVLAYSDILRLDEGGGAAPWDNGVSVHREGPAFGRIGQLLPRFSSHCFLATRDCLDEIRWDHWDLHTAEDALLIAALVDVAEPRHAPGATCVYAQGRTDGSAYLDDPARLEDEVALYSQLIGWRGAIEPKFPAEDQALRSFLAPPVVKAFEELRRRARERAGAAGGASWSEVSGAHRADFSLSAPAGRELAASLLGYDDLLFVPASLAKDRLAASGRLTGGPGKGVGFTSTAPWEVALRVDASDIAPAGCSTNVVALVEGSDAPVTVALLAEDGAALAQTTASSSDNLLVIGVISPAAAPVARIAFQAAHTPPSGPFVLREMVIGLRRAELTDAFGLDAEAPAETVEGELFRRLARRQIGAPQPDAQPQTWRAIDFRRPPSAFSHFVEDGEFKDGPSRTISTGRTGWDYFARIHIPADCLSRSAYLRAAFSHVDESFFVLLVDRQFVNTLAGPLRVPSGDGQTDVWLKVPERGAQDGAYFILQSGEAPEDALVTLAVVQTG